MLPSKEDNSQKQSNNDNDDDDEKHGKGFKLSDIYSLERPKDVVSGVSDVSLS